MKQSVFVSLVLIVSLVVGVIIWRQLPVYLQEGGPLVSVLIALTVMLLCFILERLFTLRKARGKASVQTFFKNVIQLVRDGNLTEAIAACDKQRGSLANVLRSGIDRYKQVSETETKTLR